MADSHDAPAPWRAAYALLRACTSPPGFDLVLDDSILLEHAEAGRVVASVLVGPELTNRNGARQAGESQGSVSVTASAVGAPLAP